MVFGNTYLAVGGVWKMMPDSMNGTVECYPSEGDHVIQENR
jgi:hypothetical protein